MLTKYKMDRKYKKIIAAFLGVCLVLGISASAWADNGTQSGASSAPTQQNGGAPGRMGRPNGGNDGMNGGFGGGQPGEMSDSERPDDMLEMPDGERPDDMPEMPDGERPDDMPEMPDGERPADGMNGGMPGMAWSRLVDDGVISQETCDAIEDYIKENAPDKPDDDTAADGNNDSERPEPPEKPADDDGTEPPEKPEGDESEPPEKPEDGEHTDSIPGLTEELLDALLDEGIITEDEYEALLELIPAEDVSKA